VVSVPIDTHPTGSSATLASPTDRVVANGDRARPGVLLPSGRRLRDRPRDAGPWGEPAFAREVDRVLRDLAPIVSRRALASSFAREAFRRSRLMTAREAAVVEAVRLAYAIRWLELGEAISRPGWAGSVTGRD
jgi:hypothetical protein